MSEATMTNDGHYVIADGRRWRATGPSIPPVRLTELVGILMAWRREVRRTKGTPKEPAARAGVQAAKVALEERGTPPWWSRSTSSAARDGRLKYPSRASDGQRWRGGVGECRWN
jgi:hypothetical protein